MRFFRFVPAAVVAVALLALALTQSEPATAAPQPKPTSQIAWRVASSDAEVDQAFAIAKQSGKPVFLYWGAVWCPPCNQVKATLFSRPDFVERSRAFVPVYVDGDKPGAQKVASRFKVSGYPTMILFKADGTEVTRLPGEVDPQRYLMTLTAGLDAQVPVKTLLRKALAGEPLAPEQWRLLAYYSWDTDEQQVLPTPEVAATLARLSTLAPAGNAGVRDRLAFKALVAQIDDSKPLDAAARTAGARFVNDRLAGANAGTDIADLLVLYAERVVKAVSADDRERSSLAAKWNAALERVVSRDTASRVELLDALDSRVALWKLMDGEQLAADRTRQVATEVAAIVKASTDRYERQAVVPSAAHVLAQAGLLDASDALLKAELPRAVAPYYHMLGLAGNAKKRKDSAAALQWYEQAWRKSEGPATRIQWGANYVGNVVQLTPGDVTRVSVAAGAVLNELAPTPETFYERNQRSLQRMAKRLVEWQGSDPERAKVVTALRSKLAGTCKKLPAGAAGRANCEGVFSAAG